MNPANMLKVKAAIYEMGLFFNQQPSDERITAYAKALANYNASQVIYAFKQVINTGSAFFPSLAEILKHLRPVEIVAEDRAAEITNEIISKATLHGYMQTERAFKELSPEAQTAIGSASFLLEVCNTPHDQLGTLKAQVRRLVKATIERGVANKHNQAIAAIGISSNVVPMRKIDFGTFNPTEGA
jgi:hypothetical protein